LGLILLAGSLGIAIWAWRTLPTDRVAVPISAALERIVRYDPNEWRLSWPPVIFVAVMLVIIWLLLRGNGIL
jgi:hypothetical protein